MVTPAVAPTKIPFFHPKIITIKILSIFLIPNPNKLKSPNAPKLMANIKLAPINSSIVNAFLLHISCHTKIELTNIL